MSTHTVQNQKLTLTARRYCKSPRYGLVAHISHCTQHALGRGEQSVTPAVFLARDSSTPRLDLQKEGLHFSCLRQPCRDQADTAHAKGREQPSPLTTGLLQPHQQFPPNSSAPLSFHKTRRQLQKSKENVVKGPPDFYYSVTISACLKCQQQITSIRFLSKSLIIDVLCLTIS